MPPLVALSCPLLVSMPHPPGLPPLPQHPQLPPLCPPRAQLGLPNKMSLSHLLDETDSGPPHGEQQSSAHASSPKPSSSRHVHHVLPDQASPSKPVRSAYDARLPPLPIAQHVQHQQHAQHNQSQPVSELSGVTYYQGRSQCTNLDQQQREYYTQDRPHTYASHTNSGKQSHLYEGTSYVDHHESMRSSHRAHMSSTSGFGPSYGSVEPGSVSEQYHYSRSMTASPVNEPMQNMSRYPPPSQGMFRYDRRSSYVADHGVREPSHPIPNLPPSPYQDVHPDMSGRLPAKPGPLVHEPKTKRPWTEHEDAQLRDLTASLGVGLWAAIAEHIPGRTGKQVRERWLNHLSPTVVKRPWSPEEDRIIIEAHAQYGNSWSKICKLLEGRSENMCKNRFWTKLCKLTPAHSSRAAKPGDRLKLGVQRPLAKR